MASPETYAPDPLLRRELDSVSHREYGTGFFFNSPHEDANTVASPGYIREKAYLATAVSGCEAGGVASFVQDVYKRQTCIYGSTNSVSVSC